MLERVTALTTALLLLAVAYIDGQGGRTYRAARQGCELHAQLLFCAGAQLDSLGTSLVTGRFVDRHRHERLNLDD